MNWEQYEIPDYAHKDARNWICFGYIVIFGNNSELSQNGVHEHHAHSRQEERVVRDLIQKGLSDQSNENVTLNETDSRLAPNFLGKHLCGDFKESVNVKMTETNFWGFTFSRESPSTV